MNIANNQEKILFLEIDNLPDGEIDVRVEGKIPEEKTSQTQIANFWKRLYELYVRQISGSHFDKTLHLFNTFCKRKNLDKDFLHKGFVGDKINYF